LNVEEGLEMNEDVNSSPTINVPPFSTAIARAKSADDSIMDNEKTR
jgi:hypothetical protein